jgi:hypothetical protein
VEESTGAASLWIVPTLTTGDAEASSGRRVRAEYLMAAVVRCV